MTGQLGKGIHGNYGNYGDQGRDNECPAQEAMGEQKAPERPSVCGGQAGRQWGW